MLTSVVLRNVAECRSYGKKSPTSLHWRKIGDLSVRNAEDECLIDERVLTFSGFILQRSESLWRFAELRGCLIGSGDAQDQRFVKGLADEVHAHRQRCFYWPS